MNIQYRTPNIECRKLMLALVLLCSCALMFFAVGCNNKRPDRSRLTEQQIDKLQQEKTQLQKQLDKSEGKNEELRNQIQVLAGLPSEVKGENLYRLQSVKIGGYTNFYDKDKDGKKEKLIVYLQPIDEDGDLRKVAGSVDVQLWDLSKDNGQALLGEWNVGPEKLKTLWFTALMTHYKLTFDVPEKIGESKEHLTVKVNFTDYLTGKVFKEQKVIEP